MVGSLYHPSTLTGACGIRLCSSKAFLSPVISRQVHTGLRNWLCPPIGTKRATGSVLPRAASQLRTAASSASQQAPAAPTTAAMAPVDRVPSMRQEVTQLFSDAIKAAFPAANEQPAVAPCNNPKFGDYQCNNAMALFGKLKGTEGAPKSPRAVAEAILAALPKTDAIAGTSLAGPGFINITLNRQWLATRLRDMLINTPTCWAPKLPYSRVVIDFSSPNVAKEMHVGHLRSTIIGDTLARTVEYCGCEPVRLNHIGDWGTQFGMLIQYMQEKRPEGLGNEEGLDEDVADLQVLYKAAKQRFDEEDDFKQRAREAVTRLQGGDEEYAKAWKRICAASRKEFQAIYDRLGVELEERGESFYNPYLEPLVKELQGQGVAEESEGAICIFVEGSDAPLIIQKSDGGFGYATTDMAAIRHRLTEERADWIIYVTDAGQASHFQGIFGAAKKAGWLKEGQEVPKVDHVGFGLVLGEDGKKFKTRSGTVVRLVDLLDEAKVRTYETLKTRWEEAGEEIDEKELQFASKAMGYGAVKYADLKGHRMTNYRFSFDEMLSLQGNTAVYLLYAHARIAQIMVKSGKDMQELAKTASISLEHEKEIALAMHLARFPESVEDLLTDLAPNRITEYLYDLSTVFNGFYVECKVIGSEQEASRLLLCEATAVIMRQCFSLLGITPLYRI